MITLVPKMAMKTLSYEKFGSCNIHGKVSRWMEKLGYSPFCTTLYINAFPTVSKSSFRLYVICVIFIYTRYEFLKIVCLTSVSGSYRSPLTIICSYIYLRYIYIFRVHSHFSLHKTKNVLMWKKKILPKNPENTIVLKSCWRSRVSI